MAYEIHWEPEGVLDRLSGAVTPREFIRSIEKIQGDVRFQDAAYVIYDFSGASTEGIGKNTLTHLAAFHFGVLAYHPNCRMLFAGGPAEFQAALAEVLKSSHPTAYPVEVLPTVADARKWLADQPDPHLQSVVMSLRGMYPPESY